MLALSVLLAVGCGSKQGPSEPSISEAAEAERDAGPSPKEHKTGAPVTVDAEVGLDATTVDIRFDRAATEVRIHAWGASGLQVDGERERWSGRVDAGQRVTLDLTHAGAGDLAVRIDGSFDGETIDEVRSWTVGRRAPTAVPRNHPGSKGWDATRR